MKIGVVGGSGYVGGELLRLLLFHPSAELTMVTSRKYSGEYFFVVHPNLRGVTVQKFVSYDFSQITKNCDIVITALPHGSSAKIVPDLLDVGMTVIDMGADFRLKNAQDYPQWYGWDHPSPHLLEKAVLGLPELHREEIKHAKLIACPGCMATSAILGLVPLINSKIVEDIPIVVDAKIGSSGAGSIPTIASHHSEKFGGIRPYKVVHHRHIAEIEQELNLLQIDSDVKIAFSPHSVNMVRGILSTMHVFVSESLKTKDVWNFYRSQYGNEPFIRIVRYKKGLYRFPDPKVVFGTNFCDIGFELDSHVNRLVVFSAIDNMMKGSAGLGVQCLNILLGLDERKGLEFVGFHPG